MQNNFFSLLSMLSNVKNPETFIQGIIKANPNLQPAYDKVMEIKNSGQSLEQYAKNIMKAQNINLDNLTSLAKQFMPH